MIPFDIIGSDVLKGSIFRLASWVTEHGLTGPGKFQSARELLLRSRPSVLKVAIDTILDDSGELTDAAKSMMCSLPIEPCVLPIQGPPGSGKTYSGARMVVELVKCGYKVGITAYSHKVISLLLREVCTAAGEAGVAVGCVQRVTDLASEDCCQHERVKLVADNPGVLKALSSGTAVAAGTAWLWSREEMADTVDVLFVDEASQMSLANVLAIAQAATSIVLLGDPQQLDQPLKGIHPPGAEVSALRHLLKGRSTIGPDQGVFLPDTRRLHPDICAFTSEVFYDGRLVPRPENARQRLNATGWIDGTGLRFIPVAHSGNQNESPEEVGVIASLIEGLMREKATWTDKHGETHLVRIEDILILSPYNYQVAALAEQLPTGARIGTVDKFQGQEAPVVFYSMATSTPEDAPRGMEFLYSSHRFNVATSRARCVSVLVANPDLFRVQCKTPKQIELANAFCRYLEMAESGLKELGQTAG